MALIPYERLYWLFNVAALQSQIATKMIQEWDERKDGDERLEGITKLLVSAANIFGHLRDFEDLTEAPTKDLSKETLDSLSALMLAQVQELFIIKVMF